MFDLIAQSEMWIYAQVTNFIRGIYKHPNTAKINYIEILFYKEKK